MENLESKIVPLPLPVSRFKPPTIEECQLQAAKIGLPETEAEKFHAYYGSKGWIVGKSAPMKEWRIAMSGWKVRWQQYQLERTTIVRPASKGMELMIRFEELKRVEKRLDLIKNNAQYTGRTPKEKVEFYSLRARRSELMNLLGMKA